GRAVGKRGRSLASPKLSGLSHGWRESQEPLNSLRPEGRNHRDTEAPRRPKGATDGTRMQHGCNTEKNAKEEIRKPISFFPSPCLIRFPSVAPFCLLGVSVSRWFLPSGRSQQAMKPGERGGVSGNRCRCHPGGVNSGGEVETPTR